MSEQLSWAQWWAFPWRSSHTDWGVVEKYSALDALCRNQHALVATAMGIEPCLPPAPHPTVLRLVLASKEQLDLALALVGNAHRPTADDALCEEQHQWCLRLSKALHPDALLSASDDPLQLLRAWIGPDIWQRLRLRFERHRVLELEKKTPLLDDAHGRLDTLWQAIVWRVTTIISDNPRQ